MSSFFSLLISCVSEAFSSAPASAIQFRRQEVRRTRVAELAIPRNFRGEPMRSGKWGKLVAVVVVAVFLAGCGSPVMTAVGDRNDVPGWSLVLLIERDASNRAQAATALGELHDPAALEP